MHNVEDITGNTGKIVVNRKNKWGLAQNHEDDVP